MSKKRPPLPRTPRSVQGGIRAQQARGGAGRAWWSRHWIAALERFGLGARLGRGRQYAIAGQVAQFDIRPGRIQAMVQGAEAEPYTCTIAVDPPSPETRDALIAAFRDAPMLAARLLVQDLPPEVETLFHRLTGRSLFPIRRTSFSTRCTCRDWANPCKHLAAVYFLFGETIARDPFQLLAFHGLPEHDLLGIASGRQPEPIEPPIPADTADFWGHAPREDFADYGPQPEPGIVAPLLIRLASPPLWRGQERFGEVMETVYTRARTRGQLVWDGERIDYRRPEDRIQTTGGNLRLRHQKLRIDSMGL